MKTFRRYAHHFRKTKEAKGQNACPLLLPIKTIVTFKSLILKKATNVQKRSDVECCKARGNISLAKMKGCLVCLKSNPKPHSEATNKGKERQEKEESPVKKRADWRRRRLESFFFSECCLFYLCCAVLCCATICTYVSPLAVFVDPPVTVGLWQWQREVLLAHTVRSHKVVVSARLKFGFQWYLLLDSTFLFLR